MLYLKILPAQPYFSICIIYKDVIGFVGQFNERFAFLAACRLHALLYYHVLSYFEKYINRLVNLLNVGSYVGR